MVTALWSKICHNWFIKCIFAGIVALVVLSLFSVLYYNPPIHVPAESNATDYTRESNCFWSRGTEGFASGTTDDDGYNNAWTSEEEINILLMGSSQTEGLYVDADENLGYVLNEKLTENKTGLYAYNIGMSSHSLLRNISNLDIALSTYEPTDYVVLETDVIDFSTEEIDAALFDQLPALDTYQTGILYQLQRIPYVKLVYEQYQNYIGTQVDEQELIDSVADDGNYNYGKIQELLASVKNVADAHDVEAVIYFYPHLSLQEDGTLATSRTEQKMAWFAQICEENGIHFVDMTDAFLEEYEKNHVIVSGFSNTAECYGHLNKYGHRLIAEAIYEAVTE